MLGSSSKDGTRESGDSVACDGRVGRPTVGTTETIVPVVETVSTVGGDDRHGGSTIAAAPTVATQRPVLNLRGEMPPVEFAPRRSRQQNRPHKGEKPNRRRRAATALVIRLVLRSELRAVLVAPAYSPKGSVLDVLAFGSAETSAPTFRRLPTIGIWARLFEPTSHHRKQPRPIRLGVY
jgi:hypothetical protein